MWILNAIMDIYCSCPLSCVQLLSLLKWWVHRFIWASYIIFMHYNKN